MKKIVFVILFICFLTSSSVGEVLNLDSFKDMPQKAKQGNKIAQYNLGLNYFHGQGGVSQDYKQAFYWYKKSAEQGFDSAQYNLGKMYYNGQGVFQDYKQTIYWYKKAALQKHVAAQFYLALMYYKGKGVPQNYKQAYIWFSIAATQGDQNAVKNRDIIAEKLTPQDISEAQATATAMFKKH